MQAIVTELWIYPVKSCRGISLPAAELASHGLVHDREWMLVDADGQFVTQRTKPRMALVETELTAEALWLRAPGMHPLEVPYAAPARTLRPVTVWSHSTVAWDEGECAASWFDEFLEGTFRLVRWDPARRRPSDPKWTGEVATDNQFNDGFPYLLQAEETLADLNHRMGNGAPLPMNRFRPNLVIRGLGVGGEDRATKLHNGLAEFHIVKPCTRCVITTTDQQTAVRGEEPLRTLAKYRRDPRFSAPVFSQNLVLARGAGTLIQVGDRFEAA